MVLADLPLAGTPVAVGRAATNRAVAAAEAMEGSTGAGMIGGAAGGVAACCTTGAAPELSPGHSSTRRAPSALDSSRGFKATTGAARSNTTRMVPGVG